MNLNEICYDIPNFIKPYSMIIYQKLFLDSINDSIESKKSLLMNKDLSDFKDKNNFPVFLLLLLNFEKNIDTIQEIFIEWVYEDLKTDNSQENINISVLKNKKIIYKKPNIPDNMVQCYDCGNIWDGNAQCNCFGMDYYS